jgi:hypothetical protein
MELKKNARCEKIARTGRVQDWLDSPESRLPVSCTTFVVEDTMEGPDGIEASWRFVSHGLRNGAGVAIHLSNLRGRGDENGKGLVASGPVSFGKIYSTLNEILRRGGRYKNGAAVLHLDYTHPDIIGKVVNGRYEPGFIDAPRVELPWVKRCLNVDENFLKNSSPEVIDALLKGISSGDIWLNKIRYDDNGNRIYANVCLEVYLPHRGTCLLQHVNLGACSLDNMEEAFSEGMLQLCKLHAVTGVGDTGEYLDPAVDRQVGLGILGLANFLSIHGVSYEDFGKSLEALLYDESTWVGHWCSTMAGEAVWALASGIDAAAEVARQYKMERAFCIAPTASCSYRYLDRKGFTTTPEIAPPIGRLVDRDSGTFGVESFDYGEVEIAAEVGWPTFFKVANGIVKLFQITGLMHGYSCNSWGDLVSYDRAFLQDWLESPQTSLYYSLQVMPDMQRKDDAYAALDDDFKSMFGLDDNEPLEDGVSRNLDAGFCSSCAE